MGGKSGGWETRERLVFIPVGGDAGLGLDGSGNPSVDPFPPSLPPSLSPSIHPLTKHVVSVYGESCTMLGLQG